MGNRGKCTAYLILLVLGVTAFGALTPDIIDKPLWLQGLGDGRTHHEALGYLGIVNVVVGGGIMVALFCRLLWIRFLRGK